MSYEEREDSVFEEAKATARTKYSGMSLRDLVEYMDRERKEKDRLEVALKLINAAYDVLRFESIPERMESDGVERVSYEGIGRVSLTADLRVQTKNKDALFGWLRKNKLGDLITDTVNSSTLKAFVKERMQKGKPLPDGWMVAISPITRASITKG